MKEKENSNQELKFWERCILDSEGVQIAIEEGYLVQERALSLTGIQKNMLSIPFVWKAIDEGWLSFDEAMNVTTRQWRNLQQKEVQVAINYGLLDFEVALNLSHEQCCKFAFGVSEEPDFVSMLNELKSNGVQTKIPSLSSMCAFFIKKHEDEIGRDEIDRLPKIFAEKIDGADMSASLSTSLNTRL